MRCEDCGKFVSMETQKPEVELELDGTSVRATFRIIRCCAECGREMKTADLDAEVEVPKLTEHEGEGHDLQVHEDGSAESIEEGGGRYAKSYFGVSVDWEVSCSCTKEIVASGTLSAKIAASEMDEV